MIIDIIKKVKIISLLFLPVIVLTSCATLNKDECHTADWQLIGFEDGSKGFVASRIGKHRKACAKYGVTPNLKLYNRGRAEGLHKYCIPVNGFNLGKRGLAYKGICSRYNEKIFVAAYQQGKKLRNAESELYEMQQTLEHKQADIKHISNDIHQMEEQIVSGKLTKENAILLLMETKELATQQAFIENEIHDLEHNIKEHYSYIAHLKKQFLR